MVNPPVRSAGLNPDAVQEAWLRLMRGLDLKEYRLRFGSNLKDAYASDLARLRDAGLVEIDRDVLRLTKRGALLSNEVFAALA